MTTSDKLLTATEVNETLGLGKYMFNKMVRDGTAPKGIRISERIIRWKESEINEWINSKQE